MRSNTNFGPPFFTVDYVVAQHFAVHGAGVNGNVVTPTPPAGAPGVILFAGAKDGQHVIVTPREALDTGLTIAYARVVPPVVVAGVVTVAGYIEIGFNNASGAAGADLPAAAAGITLHIEVVPIASE